MQTTRRSLGRTPLSTPTTPPSPRRIPPSPRKTQPLPQPVELPSLEEELIREGYHPISRIVMKDYNNNIRFVKAQSRIGEPIYIDLDGIEGMITALSTDPIMITDDTIGSITIEEKEMAFSKAGMGVEGVAYECENGLCTIIRDPNMNKPIEQKYSIIDRVKNSHPISMMAYPIIRMSDIRTNPQVTSSNVDQAFRRIRNGTLSKCLLQIKDVEKEMTKMAQLFNETIKIKDKTVQDFCRSMVILEDKYEMAIKNPESNKMFIDEIVFNIEKRNEKFPYLMESCNELASLGQLAKDTNCLLEKTKLRLETKFKMLGYCFSKDETSDQRCAWDV